MPAVSETVRVQGLRELQRAFKLADARLARELRTTLRQVAEPVRADAERLAVERIRRVGVPWSRMRVGVTASSVYVAPRQRDTKIRTRRRPNLADLLLGRSMEPALEQNQTRVIAGLASMLGTVADEWERA